jgi:glutaredoxin
MIDLLLYTRRDCHLCDTMKSAIDDESKGFAVRTKVVDVDSRNELAAEFGADVPVLFVSGKKFAKHRLEPGRLRQKLRRESGSTGTGGGAGP